MQPVQLTALLVGALGVVFATGCSGIGHPSATSPAVETGVLGNGGFTFKCDDSVACNQWNTAKVFPKKIASGSNFDIQFALRENSGGYVYLKDAERGTTVDGVGKYISRGASGFGATNPGIATVAARDSKGWLVDYITVNVVQPTSLVVYDAEYTGDDPRAIATVTMKPDESRSFRVVARHAGENLAGAIALKWESNDSSIVAIESYSRGKVTVIGQRSGKTQLKFSGAGLEGQLLDVIVGEGTVTPDAGADAKEGGGS